MKPQLMLIFLIGGALFFMWLLQTIKNYWHRRHCQQCGSRAPRIIKLVNKNVAAGAGYFGNEYKSICPNCGDSYTYITGL